MEHLLGGADLPEKKTAFVIDSGEKLCVVIAVGYGKNQGTAHKSKSPAEVSNYAEGLLTIGRSGFHTNGKCIGCGNAAGFP